MAEKSYYLLDTKTTLRDLDVSVEQGLTDHEREVRLRVYGKNELQRTDVDPWRVKFLSQFKDLMIILLLVTAGLSFYLGDTRTGTIVLVIVFFNAVIGYLQEAKAEKMLQSLQKMLYASAKVRIDGMLRETESVNLVPGDIVYIEEGDVVPADLRLVEEMNVQTNDFSLTGESNPQKKHTHPIMSEVELGDRTNLAFMGTTVAIGHARGVVTATGMSTELGKIASLTSDVEHELSPLQKEFNHIAKRLTFGTVIVGAALFSIALFIDLSIQEALLFALGIAASMVPQGLPAQISVALSSAASRLAKQRVLVKKLSAVETLGAVNVICTDKTGTLTKNEMTVQSCIVGKYDVEVSGVGYEGVGDIHRKTQHVDQKRHDIFFQTGVLASNATISPPDESHATRYCIGDPTEGALITLGMKAGIDQEEINASYQELAEFSFDSVRKCMSSVRKLPDGSYRVYVKGAMSTLLEKSTQILDGDTIRPITEEDKDRYSERDEQEARQAMRNLAYAYKDIDVFSEEMTMELVESELILLGMVSMIDPPRSEVKSAMHAAHDAHIKLVVITGDYATTAKAIAERIDLNPDKHTETPVVTGSELRTMRTITVLELIRDHRAIIFSRMSPTDKIRIVGICKKAGWLVAVTGDGVNDSPALKKADIGVAMGKVGTDVAKDAAEIILLDDSFSTLVSAIKEGRVIFHNLKTTTLASLTSNGGELVAVLLGLLFNGLFGWPIAIVAVQILAVDLIGEMLPLAALAWDPAKPGVMKQPARDTNEHILTKKRIQDIIFAGTLMGAVAFGAFAVVGRLYAGSLSELGSSELIYRQAMSVTYLTIVLTQFMNILSRRAGDVESLLSKYVWSNKKLLGSMVLSCCMMAVLFYVPAISQYFLMAPITLGQWGIALGGAVLFLLVREMQKRV